MEALAREKGWRQGVELGVGTGQLRARFLGLGIKCIGVDIGARRERIAEVNKLGGKMLWMTTTEAASHVPDGWADFVFVDAGHSYQAVRADIANWQTKVKPGGWFGGHDYHPKFPGVIRAVNEAFEFELLEGHIWARA